MAAGSLEQIVAPLAEAVGELLDPEDLTLVRRCRMCFVVLRSDHVTQRALCSAATSVNRYKVNAYRERHRPSEAIQANLPNSECVILRVHDAHNTAESNRQLEPEQSGWTVLMDKQGRS